MTSTRSGRVRDHFVTRMLAPGVRLHLLRSRRFTTSYCQVVLHRDLGPEAAGTAILAQVLQSATERHPTRAALAHRLADLYGAALHVGVRKFGDRQLLSAALEWPTQHVPRGRRVLAAGLELLREVCSRPKRGPGGRDLDPELVATEHVNHVRALRSLRNDKGRYALRGCVASMCSGEPFGLDPLGREEDVPAATPAVLAALHARLLATAPIEIFLVADLAPRDAAQAVGEHLLWPGRAPRVARVPAVASVRTARSRPRRLVESDRIVQGKLVFGYRAPIRPRAALAPAAETLAGVLGGGSYARLFKVVREEHGLCYYASAGWHRAKGLLLVQTGIDPAHERQVRRLVQRLAREVASGCLEESAWTGFREEASHRVAALHDSAHGMVSWFQEQVALGTDPSPDGWLARLRAVTPAAVRRAGAHLALDTTFYLRPPEPGAGSKRRRARSAHAARSVR